MIWSSYIFSDWYLFSTQLRMFFLFYSLSETTSKSAIVWRITSGVHTVGPTSKKVWPPLTGVNIWSEPRSAARAERAPGGRSRTDGSKQKSSLLRRVADQSVHSSAVGHFKQIRLSVLCFGLDKEAVWMFGWGSCEQATRSSSTSSTPQRMTRGCSVSTWTTCTRHQTRRLHHVTCLQSISWGSMNKSPWGQSCIILV